MKPTRVSTILACPAPTANSVPDAHAPPICMPMPKMKEPAIRPSPIGEPAGIGMQIGGACASGTLFAVGAGQASIVLTLVGFIAGSVLYAWQYELVDNLPAFAPIVMADHIGLSLIHISEPTRQAEISY